MACKECACDLFEVVGKGSLVTWRCTYCHAPQPSMAIPVVRSASGFRPNHRDQSSGAGAWYTGLDVHDMTAIR